MAKQTNKYAENEYFTCLLFHYGELVLKCGNRKWFEQKLLGDIRAKLRPLNISDIDNRDGRVIVSFAEGYDIKTLVDKADKVFGVTIYAPAIKAGIAFADIESAVLSRLEGRQFRSFAVRARRVDKRLALTSQEINIQLGSAVLKKFPNIKVDLDNPELTVHIDVLSDFSLVYLDRVKGVGGLPMGSSGRIACLISGGIDSPVAAWHMMKRGCHVDFVHFHSAPFTDRASIEKVEEIVERLADWQAEPCRLAKVAIGDLQRKLVTSAHEKYRVILYRRMMVRLATEIAVGLKSEALVTGEALGQVASQTLSNMATVENAAGMMMLRPLVGMDKQDITDLSRRIGTYDLSIMPHQDCCQFLEPRHPATYTTISELKEVEAALDIEQLVKDGLTNVEWMDIKAGPR
jgi:thiamine biosynthesis protein ThiI